jgi:hypothetical protein
MEEKGKGDKDKPQLDPITDDRANTSSASNVSQSSTHDNVTEEVFLNTHDFGQNCQADRLIDALDQRYGEDPTSSRLPNFQGLKVTENEHFSGDIGQYITWRAKLVLSLKGRNLSKLYKAQALYKLLEGEALEAVDVYVTTIWDDHMYKTMMKVLDRKYGSQRVQRPWVENKLLKSSSLVLMSLQTLEEFYNVVTVQITYYISMNPVDIKLPNSYLLTQVRAKISDDIFLEFVKWAKSKGCNHTLINLQKWLFGCIKMYRIVDLTSSKVKIEKSIQLDSKLDDQKSEKDTITENLLCPNCMRDSSNSDLLLLTNEVPDHQDSLHSDTNKITNSPSIVCKISGSQTCLGITTIALMNSDSDQSFIDKDTAVKLRLKRASKSSTLSISVLGRKFNTHTYSVMVHLTSINGSLTQSINAWAVKDLTKNSQAVDWSKAKEKFPHLREIPFEPFPQGASISIILAGHILHPIEDKRGKPDEPIAHRTPFGWTCSD